MGATKGLIIYGRFFLFFLWGFDMLKDALETYEELKKYIFIINIGNDKNIILRFKNENFYHLLGLHKIKIDNFFPNKIMNKDRIYKHLKANVDKYEKILENLIKEEKRILLRISSFHYILDVLKKDGTTLYKLTNNISNGSLYKGDYGLFKSFDEVSCLFGLIIENIENNIINCNPQSWMPSNRKNKIIEFKRPMFMKEITKIPVKVYNDMSLQNENKE